MAGLMMICVCEPEEQTSIYLDLCEVNEEVFTSAESTMADSCALLQDDVGPLIPSLNLNCLFKFNTQQWCPRDLDLFL